MQLSRPFIDRPILATVLSALIVLVGALALGRLPVSEYPEVVPPTIVVRALYPGASPETIAATVAGPLEQQMTGLPDMLYQFSQSTGDGVMGLTMTFRIGADLQAALVEVQNRIGRATPRLPEEVRRLGVTAEKVAGDMLMVVHLRSPDGSADMLTLSNFARLRIRDRLAAIEGVGDVNVFGAGEYSMRVWLDPERMAARSLTPTDVARAIREQNVQVAAGGLGQQPAPAGFELSLTTQGRLTEQAQFEAIVVARGDDGQLVHLRDVARLELGGSSYALRSLLDNRPAVAMAIMQAPGANALATSAQVRATMADLAGGFPPGIDHSIVYDPTEFVRASIDAVVTTLLEAVVLVVLVVILFLQTWRASLIPLIAVPVSLIGTFAVMHQLGFSINALSLFGLVLAIGIVVDDAIVVVENVERNLADGLSPRDATIRAMGEVSGPILATALVLCAVFIPTAFISGLSGRFYQQFALTIAISTVISAFNSLTLSPALAALLLRPHAHDAQPGGRLLGWFFRGFNRGFAAAADGYVWATARSLRRGGIALALYGGLLAATWWGFGATPTGFVPSQDKGYLVAFARLPDGASLDRTDAVMQAMSSIALQHPAVEHAIAFPGLSINGFTNSSNAGIVFVGLKPFAERTAPELSGDATAAALTGAFAGIEDAFILALPPPPIMGLGTTGGFKLFLQDRGDVGPERLYAAAQEVLGAARQSKLIDPMGTYTMATMGVPKVHVEIDREKLQAQGVALAEAHEALQGYFGTLYVNDFNRFGRTFQVNLQADAAYRLGTADLDRIKIRAGGGEMVSGMVSEMVPLSSLVRIVEAAGPERAMQYNTFPAIDISAAPAAGASTDQAQAEMARILAEVLPPGVAYEWTDLAYQQQIAGNAGLYVFPMCVLLVFLVLAAFYESWSLPLAIVLIVPTCLISALAGVWWIGGDNNIMTQIGLIVLVGLACKNAILIVEFAREAEQRQGLPPVQAALAACRLRLRPILMTSLAFIMGVWPLVTASGAGAELRRASGAAVFAGMIGVTVFGLLLTPVFYVAVRSLARRRRPPAVAEPIHPMLLEA